MRTMPERAKPPPDITPHAFFTEWIAASVARDQRRQRALGTTRAILQFELSGEQGGAFTVHLEEGAVRGVAGPHPERDLCVRLDVETWRALNAGSISAPEALLKRRVKLEGSFVLAIKLHLILG